MFPVFARLSPRSTSIDQVAQLKGERNMQRFTCFIAGAILAHSATFNHAAMAQDVAHCLQQSCSAEAVTSVNLQDSFVSRDSQVMHLRWKLRHMAETAPLTYRKLSQSNDVGVQPKSCNPLTLKQDVSG